jgi:hypothetical protein
MGASASTYFNPVPLFILFREAIEASIVVSVLLTFVIRSNPALKGQGAALIYLGMPCTFTESTFIVYIAMLCSMVGRWPRGFNQSNSRSNLCDLVLHISTESFSGRTSSGIPVKELLACSFFSIFHALAFVQVYVS